MRRVWGIVGAVLVGAAAVLALGLAGPTETVPELAKKCSETMPELAGKKSETVPEIN